MTTKHAILTSLIIGGVAVLAMAPHASAGPFILAGTDADEHGSASGGANQDGWLFMQKALENIAPAVTNGNKVVYTLGSSGAALTAANSAFNLSALPGQGWSIQNVDSAVNLTTFFNTSLGNAGILMMDSGGNVGGGADVNERNVFTANANAINNFLGNGGGLFSQANGFAWVSALIPGLTAPGESNTGIALTAQGTAAFPGLINQDLSTGPYHNAFANIGALPVLGRSTVSNNPIILGASAGSVTAPVASVPEGGGFLPVYLLIGAVGFLLRRQSNFAAA